MPSLLDDPFAYDLGTFLDDEATPPLGTEVPDVPRCLECKIELCEYLDVYHGRAEYMKAYCAKCRGRVDF